MNQRDGHAFIELRGVVKRYESLAGSVTALKGIDLQVQRGEFLAILGKSGSGKTTLINVLTGLDRATAGEIWVAGAPVHRLGPEQSAAWRGRTVGVVFQTFELLPGMTVLRNVMLPMDFAGHLRICRRRERAMDLLAQMEIAEHARKRPTAVSGGQQQRVAIARAMANDPPILVADEPTGSLDSSTAAAVLDILGALSAQGKTVIVASHDRDMARRASRTLTLTDGVLHTAPVEAPAAPERN
ncbi:MAG: ABC transporter ATP-binding protein [Anaerolineae bacterium]|nr:ABC transporter ATP-binding protein [Anaerolineae bacterium]